MREEVKELFAQKETEKNARILNLSKVYETIDPAKAARVIVTLDDATNKHYSMFLVEEEGTASSFQGVKKVIETPGLFSSFFF